MFGEHSISTQPGRKFAGAVSSRSACSPTAATPSPSETETDDAAFPSLVASYCRPRPIFQVRASGELRGGRRGKEPSEAQRVAVMVRHFRYLQEKEAR
jgi:hypothetical protein